MWVRGVGGVVLVALGALWIAQGSGAAKGSAMSGHGQYALLGAIVLIIGIVLLAMAWRVRSRRSSDVR